ncbi:hypothetical protein NQ317_017816 [Molorchus minor]|uniref:Uncharacterized protein n=1 Tax=Molorchus minor TaxID=1323400 RepID=A0ABQ9K1Y7_9CUCU|nr:hypothetical protein NQ317_017816 [Molorchus minor]
MDWRCLMQNVGQQYGQGAAPPHHGAPFGHPETASNTGGSITSSLRQFRKKDVDKQQVNENHSSTTESHVARVAPHNHYPPRPAENYRYQTQFPDYSVPQPVKYSEISELHPLQEQPPQSVIQKPKGKDYMEMCNVQQGHMNHLGGQQPAYAPDANLHGHVQYQPPKDHQVHTVFKPESQYFPKDAQYQPMPHQIPKYSMPPGHAQVRKYPSENDFLSQLRRLNPSMARSIMSEHQMQESQPYQSMDQNRMYQNQRYMNYPSGLQGSPYSSHGYMPPQNYGNYPPSCSYTRPPQMAPRFPAMNPHERSMSPRRRYSDNLPINSMNYGGLPQKISPNYPQYNAPEYAQHYQHRRTLPEYYQQPCRSAQYLSHQINPQEIPESRVTVSDSIKQYIENWADEETASEMNQIETNRLIKETIRVRDDQSTETVYMINASELQYLENGIPIVTSENIPLVTSENGQYIIKSGVSIDNSTGMVRIMEKTNPIDPENGGERVVNLHIMDPFKPDCMLASKPNDPNQRQEEVPYEKPKVVIHQNTVIHPSNQKITIREAENEDVHNKIGSSLPIIDGESPHDPLEKFEESIF